MLITLATPTRIEQEYMIANLTYYIVLQSERRVTPVLVCGQRTRTAKKKKMNELELKADGPFGVR